ncbi:MAG: hypothetical protein LBI10_08235 [Deltaproteobacteria bacterium]|jgi:hypothetical protein|nr:hypothetical protein [Deltaproteobacteria bacterium]
MTIFQFKKRKLIDEVILALTEEDQEDLIEDILVITRKASGSNSALMAGLTRPNSVIEFIGCLEAAKIELIMSGLRDDDD